jgi:preprotein translocase subunit SecA
MAKQDIPILGPIINRIIGSRNDRFVRRYNEKVNQINKLEPRFRALTDQQLKEQVVAFRARFDKGETEDKLIPEVFAAAREAMDRSVGIRQVFNPARGFDPSTLPPEMQRVYADLRAQMDALPPAPPVGPFQGCAAPQPGYMQVDIPPTLYDAVRALFPESRPPYRARPFDVQLIGAMVLAQGKIAEMKTGEGKTIVGPLATYLACVERHKVHVVTVNDYLVQRDRDWTFPFFHALGLTVGAIHPMHMQPEDLKRVMYSCDVVYGTTSEFGFDYLRDNMKQHAPQQVQKRRDFAIVDEVDSTLIDEARTPLIISGPAHNVRPRYELADQLAKHLAARQQPWQDAEDAVEKVKLRIKGLEGDIRTSADKTAVPGMQAELKRLQSELPALEAEKKKHVQYYEVQLERKACHLTHDGVTEAQRIAGVGSFYVGENMDMPHLLEQAIRAHVVYQRDRDYIVMDQESNETGQVEPHVVIVDVNTGRPMVGRQWSDGLHQACEAKEGVPIKRETQTVATITIQNFFKMYRRLSGMTGTADTEAQEFHDIYKLDVVAIPTNKPVVRKDNDDVVYLRQKDKWKAIVDEIKNLNDLGRPVLVGTTSVDRSEMLAKMLDERHGVKHEVLNAKQHEREAHIVENAGQIGAVMIATNMAGRGTDIKLGKFDRQQLLDHWLRRGVAPREAGVGMTDEQLREAVYRKVAVAELGGAKRDYEGVPFDELEMKLLRLWAEKYTLLSDGQIRKASAETLRKELDANGKTMMHRVRWFESVEDLGGLHVIGTERHESRRIDNQLRGRSGRQGDKGSSRFYVSLEDDLMKQFGGETTQRVLATMGMKEGMPIESAFLSKRLEAAQRKVEERNFQYRKQILDYDEVMEYQRRRFYTLRQRVIEGRDLRGLIFEFIEAAVREAVTGSFLHAGYASQCVSELVRQKLDIVIPAGRLRKMEPEDMIEKIRTDALSDTKNLISVTLGEYMPMVDADPTDPEAGGSAVDFDASGLIRWARDRFGVELTPDELKTNDAQTRRMVEERLLAAAEEKIDTTDLSAIVPIMEKGYGLTELSHWVNGKFEVQISPEELKKVELDGGHEAVVKLIVGKANAAYVEREVEMPVQIRMMMTMQQARQSPIGALTELVGWANARFKLNWQPQSLMSVGGPQQVAAKLQEENRKWVEGGELEKAVKEAQALKTDAEVEAFLRDRFGAEMPDSMKFLTGDERSDAIRAKVEESLRGELIQFERMILLRILDEIWREHLFAMDQLRDTINYRAYSQQDPRIEYKREGSRMFNEMMENVRERVTDLILKVEVAGGGPQGAPGGRPMGSPGGGMGGFGSSITGPGLGV